MRWGQNVLSLGLENLYIEFLQYKLMADALCKYFDHSLRVLISIYSHKCVHINTHNTPSDVFLGAVA